ncbi:MAG: FMN-binding negative transcriptional regulator [Caulobacteraceae bacterium]|nr:MAG: FMN-binding negative transcriptional regulator [Caulobacteraceae bacterium]
MHPAPLFRETDEGVLAARVTAAPFALICASDGGRPVAAHAPVLLDGRRLRFHLSRANPVARALVDGSPVLAVVTGPHAYISPDWYGLEDQVGTWNYLSVELEGPARILGAGETTALLDDLSDRFEGELLPKPVWTRDKMSEGRFEILLKMIVGYEVAVERFEGVTKLGQNKPAEVRAKVAEALEAVGETDVAGLMSGL